MLQLILALTSPSFPGGSFAAEQDLAERYPGTAGNGFEGIPVVEYNGSIPVQAASDILELVPVEVSQGGSTFLVASPAAGGGWFVIDTVTTSMPLLAEAQASWIPGPCSISLSSHDPGSAVFNSATWSLTDEGFVLDWESSEDWDQGNLQAVEENLANGFIIGATHSLLCVMYPEQYYDPREMAARFLVASYLESLRLGKDGLLEEAFRVYSEADEAYIECGLDPIWYLETDDLGQYGNPLRERLADSLLVEILYAYALAAVQSGHHGFAELARDAAAVLE